jgi:hypothetical protein
MERDHFYQLLLYLVFDFYLIKNVDPNFVSILFFADIEELIEECASQLGMSEDELLHLLATLAAIVQNQEFVQQSLDINDAINLIAAEN